MTSKAYRTSPVFLRNEYKTVGLWNIPIIKKQSVDLDNLELISYSDISSSDTKNLHKGVHFFVDDYRFETMANHPESRLSTLSKYRFVLTPDYSTYAEMPMWRQIESIGKSRWVGANWQRNGLTVIPTISWGLAQSFDFCFSGIAKQSIVAIGMVGCKHSHIGFMHGYNEMLNRIDPSAIICFGEPYPEMEGHLIVVDYKKSRTGVR